MKLLFFLINIILILTIVSCGSQYVQDPNANVLVTYQYENEPPKIVFLPNSDCKPKINCNNKQGSECAVILYKKSESFIEEGSALKNKKLYLSAQLSYMQAMCRLAIAKIINKRKK